MEAWRFLCVIAFAAAPVLGQNGWNKDAQTCNENSGDLAIEACTRAISSGELSQANLSVTYMNRGVEWRKKGLDDNALTDYNVAIQLSPNNSQAYNNRGNVWVDKSEHEKAVADYNQAIRLNPNYARAYANRGVDEFVRGDFATAKADFTRNHELKPADTYAVLWLALVGMHQKDSNWRAQLEQAERGLNQDWPWPLIRLYGGQITADQALAAAGDTSADPERLCEVGFYVGEWMLAHGQTKQAVAYLRQAQSKCSFTDSERWGSVGELKRLGSN
jgi:lipoprotein NlpI